MAAYEYSVIPAPAKGVKAKGVKTPEARFAHALQDLMNEMGAEGWEYQRAETLPSTERSGLTGTATQWRHVLVFRRPLVTDAVEPLKIEHKQEVKPDPKPESKPKPEPESEHPAGQRGATTMQRDNGVEETSEVSGLTESLSTLAKNRKSPFDSDV